MAKLHILGIKKPSLNGKMHPKISEILVTTFILPYNYSFFLISKSQEKRVQWRIITPTIFALQTCFFITWLSLFFIIIIIILWKSVFICQKHHFEDFIWNHRAIIEQIFINKLLTKFFSIGKNLEVSEINKLYYKVSFPNIKIK